MSVVHLKLTGSLALVALCLYAPPAARAQDAAAAEARHVETLVARGLHPLAIKEARRFLERHPQHAEADAVRLRLAGALVESGQVDEARELYAALATRPSFALRGEAALRLGRLEWTAGRLDAAAAALVRALEAGPAVLRADAAQLLGEVEYRRGRHAEAEAAWQRAEQESEHLQVPAERPRVRRAALSGRAWCAFHAQRWDEVIARIDELVAEQPEAELDELWLLAGDAHARAGRHAQARAAFARVRAAERQELALRGGAFAALDAGDERGAEQGFLRLLERYPRGAHANEAAIQLGALRLRGGDARGALKLLSSAPLARSAEAQYWRARCEQALDRDAAALESLERALALEPAPELATRAQALRAELLFAAGRTDDARAALAATGSDAGLAAAMAEALNDGRLEVAATLAADLLARFPNSARRAEAELVLAEQQFQTGQHAAALRAFDTLERDAADAGLRRRAATRAAWAAWRSGALAEAATRFAALEGTAAEAGERGELRALRARCVTELAEERTRAGDPVAASSAWRDALEIDPALAPRARIALAWAAYEQGDAAAAVRELEQCLQAEGLPAQARREALELSVFAHALAGDAESAAAAWRALARSAGGEPGKPGAQRNIEAARRAARALEEAGDASGALRLLDECLNAVHEPELALGALEESTWLALGLGRIDEAEQRARALAQASARSPEAARACRAVADARLARQELALAQDVYALAARAPGAERAPALYGQAWCALESGDLSGARQLLDTLLAAPELGDLAARAAYLAGEAAWRAQDARAAATHYRRALAAGLDQELAPRAWLRTVQGELGAGRAAAAIEALERLDEVLAGSGRPFEGAEELALTRGRALLAAGRSEAALPLLGELAAREPSAWSARAELELAAHARALGDDDEALSRDLRVIARYGGEVERSRALFDAAASFERRGDREQARAHWQELLDAHAKSALASEARARLAALARAPAGARKTTPAGANRR